MWVMIAIEFINYEQIGRPRRLGMFGGFVNGHDQRLKRLESLRGLRRLKVSGTLTGLNRIESTVASNTLCLFSSKVSDPGGNFGSSVTSILYCMTKSVRTATVSISENLYDETGTPRESVLSRSVVISGRCVVSNMI
jgi:hypothetical protein